MRKPDRRIFAMALDLLGLEPQQVVFVDDQRGNVGAAAAIGMRTIHAGQFDEIAGQLHEHVTTWASDER